jgi:uncharacterized protein YneF (UPF0154 family)
MDRMNKLRKQIKYIEADILDKNAIIKQHTQLLTQHIAAKHIILLSMLGSFTLGFYIAQQKMSKTIIKNMIYSSLKLRRLYKAYKHFYS